MLELFITGTDTDAGKTLVSSALMHLFVKNGLEVVGFKPIAAGASYQGQQLVNDDALILQRYSSMALDYQEVNPICFEEAIAPHIAAEHEQRVISANIIQQAYLSLRDKQADVLLCEGAGGWQLPINRTTRLPSVFTSLCRDVIVVVGMKLGCLNHALLTIDAVAASGYRVVGWVANQVDQDMLCVEENLASLKDMIPHPCLGYVPFVADPAAEKVATYLTISPLLAVTNP